MRRHMSMVDFTANDVREQLVAFHVSVRRRVRPRALEFVQLFHSLLSAEVLRTATRIAAVVDRSPRLHKPAYHNVSHYLDVTMTAFVLAQQEAHAPSGFLVRKNTVLSSEDLTDCFLAGLIHDLGHRGGNNRRSPFKFEKQSWNLAQRLAPELADRVDTLYPLVLATDPVHGIPVVEELMRYHAADPSARMSALSQVARHAGKRKNSDTDKLIAKLKADPKLTAKCYILNKSDIAFALMPETFEQSARALHDENIAAGVRVRLLNHDGTFIRARASYFANHIAHIDDKGFLLDSVETLLGKSARATIRQELIPHPSHPRRSQSHSGLMRAIP